MLISEVLDVTQYVCHKDYWFCRGTIRIRPLVLSPNERAMIRRDVEYKLRGVSRGLAHR